MTILKQTIWSKYNRVMLYNVLPLNTPFTLAIGASSACNFRCDYCIHSLSNRKLKEINFNLEIMKYDLFTKLIDDCKFHEKIKTLQFLKDGEQLINKRLSDMILYAKRSNKFEKVELLTNGSLLTHELNVKLIDSGLDTIRISLQGLNAKKYNEISNVHINFEKFIENIKHFYENRKINGKNCKVHLKMINNGIINEKDMEIFNDICDEFSVQHIIPYFTDVNYSDIEKKSDKNIYGETFEKSIVCSRPFMSIYVSADGHVMPCCREDNENLILGNIKNESIFDIWNGKNLRDFRILQLKNKRFEHIICKDCCLPDKITLHEDNLDNYTEELLKYY